MKLPEWLEEALRLLFFVALIAALCAMEVRQI